MYQTSGGESIWARFEIEIDVRSQGGNRCPESKWKSSTIYMSRCIERRDIVEDRLGLHLHEAGLSLTHALTLCLFNSTSDDHIFTYTSTSFAFHHRHVTSHHNVSQSCFCSLLGWMGILRCSSCRPQRLLGNIVDTVRHHTEWSTISSTRTQRGSTWR